MFIQKKKGKKQKTKKSHWRLSLVKVFVILKAPYERIRINFSALMVPTSKMQTLINYLFSTNFSVWWFRLLYRYDRLSWNRRSFLNCQTHVKHHNIFRQSSVPQKLLNCQIKVVLSFFFNCRERRRIYKFLRRIWRIIVLFTNSFVWLTFSTFPP